MNETTPLHGTGQVAPGLGRFIDRRGGLRLSRRLRATIYGFFYMAVAMVGLPYLFARWLGIGSISPEGILAGGTLLAVGLALFLCCVVLFVQNGKGTQSPMEPPSHFVAVGPYRVVRNPMLLGNLLVLLGEAAVFASRGFLVFAVLFFACCHLILLVIEEPALRRRFGVTYETYRREVPRWLPRISRAPRTR